MCLDLSLPAPQIPPIFISPFGPFTFDLGQLGITCCAFTLPLFTIPISFPGGPVLAAAIKAVNAAILANWQFLISIPNCPKNGQPLI